MIKGNYQSYMRKKNIISVERLEIITYQIRTFRKPNILYIKSVITEHTETSRKLSQTMIQAKMWVIIIV